MNNKHPPKENMARLSGLMDKWLEYFRGYCCENDTLGRLLFHLLVGKVASNIQFKYANEDMGLRISVFVIQPSGTGKGQSRKPVREVAKRLELKYDECLEASDAALAGTICQEKKKGEVKIINGPLATADIIVFTEGESLLARGTFNKNIYAILQGGLDEPGQINKKMALGEISYPTNTAFLITSYMVQEFHTALLEKGLLQRLIVVKRDFSTEQRKRIEQFILNSVHRDKIVIPGEFENALKELKKLGEAKAFIEFDKADFERFKGHYSEYTAKVTEGLDEKNKIVMESFLTRLILLVLKIACQSAIINERRVVSLEDLDYALDLCKVHLESIRQLLGQDAIIQSEFLGLFKEAIAKNQSKPGKVEAARYLVKHTKIGEHMGEKRAQEILEELAEKGILKREKDPNSPNKIVFSLPDTPTL